MKIFVIDDDIIARMALIDVIKSVGGSAYRIIELDSGDAAWEMLQGDGVPPMLVCCDIRMPGMSGLNVLEKVRGWEKTRELPFVLISSSNDAETIKKAATMAVTGYIVKPFVHEDASARLTRFLTLARSNSMEAPAQTIERLKITTDRYNAYLSGMRSQIAQLFAEINVASDAAQFERINSKIDAFKTGCSSLGLWRAAKLLDSVRLPKSGDAHALESLTEILQHIQYQTYTTAK